MLIYVRQDIRCPAKYTCILSLIKTVMLVHPDGVHPFYMDVREPGNAHGVFLKNSNAMDIVMTETSLQYKITGGTYGDVCSYIILS